MVTLGSYMFILADWNGTYAIWMTLSEFTHAPMQQRLAAASAKRDQQQQILRETNQLDWPVHSNGGSKQRLECDV